MNEPEAPNEGAESAWNSWLDWAASQGLAAPSDPGFATLRARVWEASDYVATRVARHPEDLAALLESGDLARPYGPGDLAGHLSAALADIRDETALHQSLRRLRHREMVRIIWRDIGGLAPLDETLEDLSELADCCIRQAWICSTPGPAPSSGRPRDAAGRQQRLVVLGMGKLGARELNLSSDIDLIFAFPSHGRTQGGPRELNNEQFFTRLAQRLVLALDNQTIDGFVFRVDTRLRPFGDSGPLVMSFDVLEDYYQSQAREWERYAMIKARVVAGDRTDVAALESLLRPFVYRRYLDFGAIESLREMKRLIAKELHQKGMESNIKLGPGGIREIEFIGQAFQLIRGGRDPELQIRPIRAVLAVLGRKGLMPAAEVERLDAAYQFLRLVENRLQACEDKQTHLLPADGAAGCASPDPWASGTGRSSRRCWESTAGWSRDSSTRCSPLPRETGRQQPPRALAQLEAEASRPLIGVEPELAALWNSGREPSRGQEVLARFGFANPQDGLGAPPALSRGRGTQGTERQGGRAAEPADAAGADSHRRERDAGSGLGAGAAGARVRGPPHRLPGHADRAPQALVQLVRLTGMSPWIADQIARHPLLLDELLDPRRLFEPLRREELDAELDTLLARVDAEDLEQQMERLRQFAQGNMLRVAAADLTGVVPLMKVSDYLTEIAEATVARVLRLAWEHLAGRHGRPAGTGGRRDGAAGARLRQARRDRAGLRLRPGPGVSARERPRLGPRPWAPAHLPRAVLRPARPAHDPHDDHPDPGGDPV